MNMFEMAVRLTNNVRSQMDEDYDRWIASCEETSEAISFMDKPEEELEVINCSWCQDRGCRHCLCTDW